MTFIAHINNEKEELIQTCTDHCRNTAKYAANDLQNIGLKKAAYLAGLLHDCGKFTPEFREYIKNSALEMQGKKGSVIHSFAGVYYLMDKYHNAPIPGFSELTAELLSYAIGAHHGLFDCYDENSKNGYIHRLTKQPEYEKKAIENFLAECASRDETEHLFANSCAEITEIYQKFLSIPNVKINELQFYAGMMARILTSAVINGDRRDTAEFMGGSDFSTAMTGNNNIWAGALSNLECYLKNLPSDTEIGKARKDLSDYCKAFAGKPSNIYRLNLPTGAGKTLSGMRYALTHAIKYNKKRIFYVAPLISILDQNAKVIRDAVGNDNIVLEHHSNVVMDQDNSEKLNRYQLLAETWDSPIIVTTLVQFLNTLFSGKTSCIRRMKSLCDSVIIIDEVQTVPTKMLTLFNLAINFLSTACNADILLCSATQPCLEKADHPLLLSTEEAIPPEKWDDYNKIFKRTNIIHAGRMNMENEIVSFVQNLSKTYPSILIVCNKKSESAELFRLLHEQTKMNCYHLSSGMCMAHRRVILERIQNDLRNGIPLICVSTQVIEAGVDISFSAGIRLTAGLDSIVQTAGRVNRNNENVESAPVYVIGCIGEDLNRLREISEAKDATDELLTEFEISPEFFGNDLSSKSAADYYYKTLYRHMKIGQQDFTIPDKNNKNSKFSLFGLLSDNSNAVEFADKDEKEKYFMHQAFAKAGKLFKALDDNTQTLLVPYQEAGIKLIGELTANEAKFDFGYRKKLLNQAKEYSVNVFDYQIKKLEQAGAIRRICDDSVLVLSNEAYYDKALGLDLEGGSGECSTLIL